MGLRPRPRQGDDTLAPQWMQPQKNAEARDPDGRAPLVVEEGEEKTVIG